MKRILSIIVLFVLIISLVKAIEIAVELQITLYDASYLALALEIGVPFITADRELYEKGREVAETIHASEMT